MASLTQLLTNIANAIRTKKGTTETINAQNFASEIENLPSIKTLLDTTKTARHLFFLCKSASIDNLIKYDDTSNVTDMYGMFEGCINITTIPKLNTSSCTSMYNMFISCDNLNTIPLLDTSNVTDMGNMFNNCYQLTTIPKLDTSKVTSMHQTFSTCRKLLTIDITYMCNSNYGFAYSCYSLTKLIIRNMDTIPTLSGNAFTDCYHFYGTTNAIYNPEGLKDGRIYVPDNKVDELKVATNWSVFADIIVPLSTLVEE